MTLTRLDMENILGAIKYQDWKFHYDKMDDGFYIQVQFRAKDSCPVPVSDSEQRIDWNGRKWYISRHSTEDEVVQTCLKAVLTAVEHEAREQFTYLGKPIFQPHMNLKDLLVAAERKSVRS